jgi:DNA-directed RNA polymerase specialized sigma24 family protein
MPVRNSQTFPLGPLTSVIPAQPADLRPILPEESDEIRRMRDFSARWTAAIQPVRACLMVFLADIDLVDDCVQEVAVVAWRKAPLEAPPQEFVAYCLGCARRVALAARRRMISKRLVFLSPDVANELSEIIESRSRGEVNPYLSKLDALRSCLSELRPEQRELLEIRYSSSGATELTELASTRMVKIDSLYKKLERLREVLRKCVANHLEEEQS